VQWSTFDRKVLHAYRREHRLNTPTSFSNPYRQWILSQSNGIGMYSPTMVRKRQARRQSKNDLTLAARKHFNGMGVQENDVIVDFIYKIHHDPMRVAKGSTVTK
jgi:histone deacetylase complex subunit SAP30